MYHKFSYVMLNKISESESDAKVFILVQENVDG